MPTEPNKTMLNHLRELEGLLARIDKDKEAAMYERIAARIEEAKDALNG